MDQNLAVTTLAKIQTLKTANKKLFSLQQTRVNCTYMTGWECFKMCPRILQPHLATLSHEREMMGFKFTVTLPVTVKYFYANKSK